MDRRLFILALGMFALGTDSFVVAGILPEVSGTFRVSIGAVGQLTTAYAILRHNGVDVGKRDYLGALNLH